MDDELLIIINIVARIIISSSWHEIDFCHPILIFFEFQLSENQFQFQASRFWWLGFSKRSLLHNRETRVTCKFDTFKLRIETFNPKRTRERAFVRLRGKRRSNFPAPERIRSLIFSSRKKEVKIRKASKEMENQNKLF